MKINTDSLFESFCSNKDNEKEMFLVEGLVIDEEHRKVRLADEHDNGVDFSNDKYLEFNLRFDSGVIDVVSLFRRTWSKGRYEELAGNPFIYALKNRENNPKEWQFEITDTEIYKYIHRFLEACNAIDKEYDTIIMVPSSHVINRRFMNMIIKHVKANNKIEDKFYKTLKTDAYNSRDIKAITDYCEKQCEYDSRRALSLEETILQAIDSSFDNMKGKYFKASEMDEEYIRFIRRIVSPNKKYTVEKTSELLRGKRVLVLDDTLSTGATTSLSVQNILRYGPSKLQVITLLASSTCG